MCSSNIERQRLKSGNHGSDSSEQSAAPGVQGTFSTAPRQSQQAFVPPVTVPVKKLPKINDLMKDPELMPSSSPSVAAEQSSVSDEPLTSQVDQANAEAQEGEGSGKEVSSSDTAVVEGVTEAMEVSEVSEVTEKFADTEALDTTSENETPQITSPRDEKFVEAWNTMFELLFREIPTIYYPLKGESPQMEQHVVHVKVKNEMMKENFESRVRLALEYLRNNYDPQIDDIRVEIETNSEQTSKLIYDTQDKMNDLYRENSDLPEFLKILNLSAKDM